jgi:hypothetical protein
MESKTKERLVEDLRIRFWSKWESSSETEKPKEVAKLTGVASPPYMTPTLFNSYCVDLYEFLRKKYKFDPMEKM